MALIFRAAIAVRRRLSADAARAVGRRAGEIGWACLPGRRRIVADNLRRTAADRSDTERERLCRATFRHLGACTADLLNAPYMTGDEVLDLAERTGMDRIQTALAQGRGAILVTPHIGNWDLAGVGLAALGFPAHAVVEPIAPARDAVMRRLRGATGLRLITLGPDAAHESEAVLARGELLVLVGDRAMGTRSEVVEFAGGRRAIPVGPAVLALATGAPLLIAYAVLAPDGSPRPYLAVIEPPVDTADLGRRPVAALTARVAARLGDVVLRYPDQWFVFQPEWEAPSGDSSPAPR